MKHRGAKEKVRCEALVVFREVEIVGDLFISQVPNSSTLDKRGGFLHFALLFCVAPAPAEYTCHT